MKHFCIIFQGIWRTKLVLELGKVHCIHDMLSVTVYYLYKGGNLPMESITR